MASAHSLQESIDPPKSGLDTLTRTLHIARYEWAKDRLRNFKPRKVLDAASGRGYGTAILSEISGVIGIDLLLDAAAYSQANYGGPNVAFVCMDLASQDFRRRFTEGSVDAIVSFETLEHCERPTAVLENFYRALRRGGILYVSVPNGLCEGKSSDGRSKNVFHLNQYTPSGLKNILSNSGFSSVKLFGQAPLYGLLAGRLESSVSQQTSASYGTLQRFRDAIMSPAVCRFLATPRTVLIETSSNIIAEAIKN